MSYQKKLQQAMKSKLSYEKKHIYHNKLAENKFLLRPCVGSSNNI
jgi:hypothetical protein